LAGGTLSGKYLLGERGRATGRSDPTTLAGLRAATDLQSLAAAWGIPAAQLALAFVLDHARLASVLFGATSAAQIATNLGTLDVHASLDPEQRPQLRRIGQEATD
jgi:aryl-alcohol dehydrogenase-like predicted oxidoreductase